LVVDEGVLRHYLREDVQAEVSKFCRNRWVALECTLASGKRIFYRYLDDRPITISEPADVKKIVNRLGRKVLRTIYASSNIYTRLSGKDDVSRLENISRSTPSIDIDCSLEEVGLAIEAAETIIDELIRHGVHESVYLIWSGRGIHIHINENAVSEKYWRRDPVNTGYIVIEYLLGQCRERLVEICRRSRAADRRLKIENLMDIQRVFTAPLSLHRELDLVAITISPDDLGSFSLDWAGMDNFRYWKEWDRYVEGEADRLVEEALESAPLESEKRTQIGGEEPTAAVQQARNLPATASRIGRFQVMALLQAARHYLIRGDYDLARSFGLNRAIFYAWAKKRGVRATHGPVPSTGRETLTTTITRNEIEEKIGDEVVFRRVDGWYTIGGDEQRPEDFDRQIASKFGDEKTFKKYWMSAIEYLQSFPRSMIESQKDFFEKVYLPVRDDPEKLLRKDRGGST